MKDRLERAALRGMAGWQSAISRADHKLSAQEQLEKFLDTSPEGDARRQRLLQEKSPQELMEYVAAQLNNKAMLDRLEGK